MADNDQAGEKENVTDALGLELKEVAKQVDDEHRPCAKHVKTKRESWRTFLKLYINQRRNPKKVGDTLMFSTHQTVLAALYDDRQSAEWMWREEEDTDRADQLNALYEFDYDEMGKASHDYGKYWDASFFGVAFEDWSHFDRSVLTPIPDLWDPLATLIDPSAVSVNGNRLGRGAARFLGRDIVRTYREMKDDPRFFNLHKLDEDSKKTSQLTANQQARDSARNLDTGITDEKDLKNKNYPLVQWFTYIDGKRYLIETGNDRNTVVRIEEVKTPYWPVIDYRIYPDPHTLWTPGVPDFTEDKQRARAILQNRTLDSAKFDVLPMWLFDKNKIKNKSQLTNFKAGKMIEGTNIDGNSVIPLTKPTIHQYTDAIMKQLQLNAEKAVATPEIQQGIMFANKRTATEVQEVSANADSRHSLTSKLFGLSEKNAALIWLNQYKRHFKKGIDKKLIRIVGAFGPRPMEIVADTFKFRRDPDVKIESRVVSLARKREEQNKLVAYGQILTQTPGANLRYFAKKAGRLFFGKDEVDRLLPATIDELRAEKENEALDKNSLEGVEIEPTDDHQVHLEVHSKVGDTKAKFAHIEAHKKAMMVQRNRPELFSEAPQAPAQQIPQSPAPATPQDRVRELTTR